MNTFFCDHCQKTVENTSTIGTGYGIHENGHKVCYQCCGDIDRDDMIKAKVGERFSMYLCRENGLNVVQNWCGTLKRNCHISISRHNWGLKRYDAWFKVNGECFWGYNIGENTQILHVRKVKPF
jgi:hypothetical protein